MEIKHIKELMAVMGRTGIGKLLIKKEGFELQLESRTNEVVNPNYDINDDSLFRQENTLQRAASSVTYKAEPPLGSAPISSTIGASSKEDTASLYVTSPMVGTLYTAPTPDDPPFIKIGDKIEKNTVVCIVEAMKVMNEVKAGVTGTVVEVLVETGHPVEFGTKLFRIN